MIIFIDDALSTFVLFLPAFPLAQMTFGGALKGRAYNTGLGILSEILKALVSLSLLTVQHCKACCLIESTHLEGREKKKDFRLGKNTKVIGT